MPDEEWIRTLADGRKVKFTNQELLGHRAFITEQVAGNEVVYSVLLNEAHNPLGREEVESSLRGRAFEEASRAAAAQKPKGVILVEKGPMTSLLFTVEVSAIAITEKSTRRRSSPVTARSSIISPRRSQSQKR